MTDADPIPSRFEGDDVVLPDDYVGAWLTKAELKARNRELAKHGRRICTKHQGAALPLDILHFSFNKKRDRFSPECRVCERARRRATAHRNRYIAAHVEAQREHMRKYYAANRERIRRQQDEYRRQRRRQQFAQIIGRAS